MKIERLSENQIRCTLNKADLAEKELLLSELAYGTDKAKELFRELMQQASSELGFEVDNIPLMIEAIPVSAECLILIITKVEDPDELDTRFSRFTKHLADVEEYESPDFDDEVPEETTAHAALNAADGLLEALGSLAEGLSALGSARNPKKKEAAQPAITQELFRVYSFKNMESVINAAGSVNGMYKGINTLYKNNKDGRYYLYLVKGKAVDSDFVKVCNMLSEYGDSMKATYATLEHFEEHYKTIIENNAVQTLNGI
ncbi:MAG: adaptor protein MecA [Clostridium sp.]|nr:adaptor protein MecA [Clostridium sp.]MCM1173347.1 adaptor protein MecA [Clostridium sp.]MCM1209055.1 adaptor protein MecA [Ruminococcus sp.]